MHQMLTQLKLARIREIHQEWFDRAAETQMPYPDLGWFKIICFRPAMRG